MSSIRLSSSVRFPKSLRAVFAILVLVSLTVGFLVLPERFLLRAEANNTYQTLPFAQNWSNIGLITTDDVWDSVPGIIGYRGDGLTGSTGTDPQTILADCSLTPVDVTANQTNPATFTTGGVASAHRRKVSGLRAEERGRICHGRPRVR